MTNETTHSFAKDIIRKVKVYDAVTATVAVADAEKIDIAGARAISLQLIEGGTVNNRAGDITVYLSNDGTNFVQSNMLVDNLTNTNSQDKTRVATKSRSSAGSDMLFIDGECLGGAIYMKVALTVTDSAAPTGNFTILANICS